MKNSVGERAGISGPAPAPDQRRGGLGWRRLQLLAAAGALASFLIPMLIQLSMEPFLLAMAAPFIVGLLVMLRWPRVGAIWLGLGSLAELLTSAPFLVDPMTHPESMADFIPLLIFTVCTLAGAAAAVPSFRERTDSAATSRRASRIAIVAGSVIAVGTAVSVVAAAGIEGVPAQEGDIRVVTEDLEFHPATINAERTTVSVHVTNEDSTRHTFTIEELGVDLNVPAHSTQRVSFEAGPGTYLFLCRPHAPNMRGKLVVK